MVLFGFFAGPCLILNFPPSASRPKEREVNATNYFFSILRFSFVQESGGEKGTAININMEVKEFKGGVSEAKVHKRTKQRIE
jgi:hypothetical protein